MDSTGAAVAAATVRVVGTDVTTTTDLEGRFALEVEAARVQVTYLGFAAAEVDVRADKPVKVVLAPEGVAEHVTVRGVAPLRSTTAMRTGHPAARRAAGGHGDPPRRDPRPGHARDGGRRALRARRGRGPGRGQPRPLVFRGNSSTADFFVDGVRDDVQYFRDLYNVERVEALKGPNAMIFGRGGGGGVINRVARAGGLGDRARGHPAGRLLGRAARLPPTSASALGASAGGARHRRVRGLGSYRDGVDLERYGINPTARPARSDRTPRCAPATSTSTTTAPPTAASPRSRAARSTTDPSTFFGDADRSRADATVDALSAARRAQFGARLTRAQPHALRATTTSSTRTSSRAR